MALVQTSAPYRQMWQTGTNVAEERRYLGVFGVVPGTGALTAFVRPSAGSQAAAGVGDLFTVTQPTANVMTWLVQITETALQPLWVDAGYNLVAATAGTGGATPAAPTAPATGAQQGAATAASVALSVVATMIDAPASGSTGAPALSNTFYVSMVNSAGTIVTAATMPTLYTGLNIWFEAVVKPTIQPASL